MQIITATVKVTAAATEIKKGKFLSARLSIDYIYACFGGDMALFKVD